MPPKLLKLSRILQRIYSIQTGTCGKNLAPSGARTKRRLNAGDCNSMAFSDKDYHQSPQLRTTGPKGIKGKSWDSAAAKRQRPQPLNLRTRLQDEKPRRMHRLKRFANPSPDTGQTRIIPKPELRPFWVCSEWNLHLR